MSRSSYAPTLHPRDIVIADNSRSHKVTGVQATVEAVGGRGAWPYCSSRGDTRIRQCKNEFGADGTIIEILLSRRYDMPYCYSYRQFEQCLCEGYIDAVYIALPNSLHCDIAVWASQAGIHVLCENRRHQVREGNIRAKVNMHPE